MRTKVKFPLYMSVQRAINGWHLHLYLNQTALIKLGPFHAVRDLKTYLFTEVGLTQAEINRFIRENHIEDRPL